MTTPFRVVFLEARVPLSKTITVSPDGVSSTPYPNVKRVTSHEHLVRDLAHFHELITDHAARGHCLYKGLFDRPLEDESRAGHTLTQEHTSWVCIDLDDYPSPDIPTAMGELGLSHLSYIAQHSASSGFTQGLRAHVFFLLTTPKAPTLLKAWLQHLNLSLGLPTELTASRLALKWPVDISTCQNDKLLYIAPPTLNVPDPVQRRVELVTPPGSSPAYDLPVFNLDTAQRMLELINELRAGHGLRRRPSLRSARKGALEVLKNPEAAVVTDIKEERGFTYLNLNGGDSWGYYYPTARPDVLFNFKDEPLYLLREIVPDYFQQLQAAPRQAQAQEDAPRDAEGIQRWVITDKATNRYWKAAYDPKAMRVEVMAAADRRRLLDYTQAYNLPEPEVILDWELKFDPTSPEPVDFERRIINTFQPTRYWLAAHHRSTPSAQDLELAKPVFTLLKHVMGDDDICVQHFVNWNAFSWQYGKKPKTAWVFHGRTGTGKGLLFEVLRALFGPQAVNFNGDLLKDTFNDRLRKAQLLLVDEIDSDQTRKNGVEAKLRNWITEDVLPIRGMRAAAVDEPSYFGVIFAANLRNAVAPTGDDRRYNIPPRQERSLKQMLMDEHGITTEAFYRTLMSETTLEAYANVLSTWEVDEDAVYTPLDNDAKTDMQQVALSSPEHLVDAIQRGDFGHLAMLLPPADDVSEIKPELDQFRGLMARAYDELCKVPYETRVMIPVQRTDLRALFTYLVGWKSPPSKFDVAMARYGLVVKPRPMRFGGKNWAAMPIEFFMTQEADQFYQVVSNTQRQTPQKFGVIPGGKA